MDRIKPGEESDGFRLRTRNLARNLTFIQNQSISLRELFGAFSSRKWILAAAGPSLDYSFQHIVALKEEGWLLAAVDMAHSVFCANDIVPDVVFSCEPKPFPFFSDPFQSRIESPVVLASTVHPYLITVLRKKGATVFSFFDFETGPLCGGLPVLPSGGNVTNAMLACIGGIKDVSLILAGNDYAFLEGRLYARGTMNSYLYHLKQSRMENEETRNAGICHASVRNSSNQPTSPAFIYCENWQMEYLKILNRSGVNVQRLIPGTGELK